MSEAHSGVISSPLVFFFFSHTAVIYIKFYQFCHCINIDSNWLGEQFYLSLIVLYVVTLQ